eukprot:2565503-Ditylum_brightwellii.AAC.1
MTGWFAATPWLTLCFVLYIRVCPDFRRMDGVASALCYLQLGTTVFTSSWRTHKYKYAHTLLWCSMYLVLQSMSHLLAIWAIVSSYFLQRLIERIHHLLVDSVADKAGGHGLVLCSTNSCFGFTIETGAFQPLMGLGKINL